MTNTATPGVPAVPGSMPFVHDLDIAPDCRWLDILWVVGDTPASSLIGENFKAQQQ